jgi:hypothetical protein
VEDQTHLPDATCHLYKAVNWGLPMNPLEVDDLIVLIKNPTWQQLTMLRDISCYMNYNA